MRAAVRPAEAAGSGGAGPDLRGGLWGSVFFDEGGNGLNDVVEHFACQARIGSDEKRFVHDFVGACEVAYNAESLRAVLLELDEDWLSDEVSSEEHSAVDFGGVEVADEFEFFEGCTGFDAEHESEPGADGVVA